MTLPEQSLLELRRLQRRIANSGWSPFANFANTPPQEGRDEPATKFWQKTVPIATE